MSDSNSSKGNWGRWGKDDQRGAANLVTADVTRQAAGAVGQGRVLSLSLPIQGSTSSNAASRVPHMKGRPLPQHFMSVDGGDYAAGASHPAGGRAMADDALMLSPHGTTTHVDALCHMWRGDEIYNGHSANRIRSYGATRCGIENLQHLVTRGVFLDIPALDQRQHLDPLEQISVEQLQAALAVRGLTIQQGDAVIIRTGWTEVFSTDPDLYWSGEPGLSPEAALWLAQQDVSLVGCDNSAICSLNQSGLSCDALDDDIHMILLWEHGIYLLEMLWLTELATQQAGEFLFMLAPLNIKGGTSSPVNPLAVL
ncbi:Kynurenine formamidase [Halioglobus japonicus]|nr:Kynurenine formamidase [Halioglobus japonicus]